MTGLQATKETKILHLTVNEDNEDSEEKQLTTGSVSLQAWYDDDNTGYTTQTLKDTIKDEHDSPQKREVFQK
eukprot:3178022-Amphidinium_carterae.1